MDFSLREEDRLIISMVKRFGDAVLLPLGREVDDAPNELAAITQKVGHSAAELGFGLDAVPESAGGLLEGRFSHEARTLRGFELGAACAGLSAWLEAPTDVLLAIAKWGTDAQRAQLYKAAADGKRAALVHDSLGRVELTSVGDGYQASGEIGPFPAISDATDILLSLVTPSGPVVALLAASTLTIEPVTPSAWRGAAWGKLKLNNYAIRAEALLPIKSAQEQAALLAPAKLSLAARALGMASAAIAFARGYAEERVQFGRPIGTFESIARMRDLHETHVMAGKLLALRAATALDAEATDAIDLVSRARDYAAAVARDATIDAVQIYGGYGFVRDYPVERLMRDARPFEVLYGEEGLSRLLDSSTFGVAPRME